MPERWQRLTDALSSEWVFRWPTFALYALMGIPFGTVSEFNRLVTPTLPMAIGVATIAVVLTIALIMVIAPFIRTRKRARVPVLIVALVGIGIIRANIVTAIIDGFDLNRESFGLSRAILSAGAVPVLVIVATFIVATIAKGWRERSRTLRAIADLRAERDAILADIARADEVIVGESEGTLRPQVNAIIASLASSTRDAIGDALENLIATVVRPLSHSLAARARTHKSTEAINLPVTPPVFPTADSFVGPLVAALAVYLTTVVILFDVVPLTNALISALIGAGITWGALRVFQALMTGLTLSVWYIVAIVVLAHLGVAMIVAWVDVSLFREYGVGLEITLAMVAGTLSPGLLYVAQRLVAHLAEVRTVELTVARRDMSLEASEVRRRAWLRQRHIAHALHSAIQSRIHAESQLIRSGTGSISVTETARITATLESMFDVLRTTDEATPDAAGELRRAIEFWSGMCVIDFSLDESVEALLATDPDIGETVLVTSLEIINNAIRHGKATHLALTICRSTVDLIRIEAINDGQPLVDYEPGLGMSMFDELTVQWSMTSGEKTTFTGFVAARQHSAAESAAAVTA